MTDVEPQVTELAPAACCEGCPWVKQAPDDDPNPAGYVRRAAEQHARDTGHATTMTRTIMTTFEPAPADPEPAP